MKKYSRLQAVLTVVSVCCLLISNVIASRQFLLPFGITMTSGMLVFPITYILSDVFSECYGYRASRTASYLGFAMNLLMVIVFQICIHLPVPEGFGAAEAYTTVLANTPYAFIASVTGFLLGDLTDDLIFKKLKEKHSDDSKGFALRAFLSSLGGEIVDSGIFITMMFINVLPLDVVLTMMVTQTALKLAYELAILPVTTFIVKKVNNHERNLLRTVLSEN